MSFSRKERVLKTRAFQLWDEKYQGDSKMVRLTQATETSLAHLYRVHKGNREISQSSLSV